MGSGAGAVWGVSGSGIAVAPVPESAGEGRAIVVVLVVGGGLGGIHGFVVEVAGFVVVVVGFVVVVVGFVVAVVGFVVGGDVTVVGGRHHDGASYELQSWSDPPWERTPAFATAVPSPIPHTTISAAVAAFAPLNGRTTHIPFARSSISREFPAMCGVVAGAPET